MLTDLYKVLKQSGIPYTYGQWYPAKPPALPYLVALETDRDDFYADGTHYHKLHTYEVGLYFTKKDPAVEQKLEGLFDAASGLSWTSGTDTYIDTDRYFERPYSIEMEEK